MALGWSRVLKGRRRWLALVAGVSLAILLLVIAKPVHGAPGPAKSAQSFVDSVGVNTHIQYWDTKYGDFPLIKDKLSALGVSHVRDGAYLTSDPNWNNIAYSKYKDLDALGIKGNLIVDPRGGNLSSIDAEKIRQISEMSGGFLESFEGPNELDISGKSDWADTLRAYQRSLYAAVKNNPSTANIPVLGPSLTSSEAYTTLGDLSAYMDYGNVHNYYGGRHPGTNGWGPDGYGSIDWNLRNARKNAGSKPTFSTETGYHNLVPSNTGHVGTPEGVVGRYMPRLYLEHFNNGIPRTYAYEFIDERPDSDRRDSEQHFGLLRNDGSEKPAYKSLKNLLGLLKDSGPAFTPGSLDYSLSGDTTDVRRTLLQKSDGKFYLVLWVEKPSWDPNAQRETSVPEQRVTLTLNQEIGKAATYRTNDSATATKQYTDPKQLTLDIPDHPLVVELESPGSEEPTTCAAGQYLAEYYNNQTLDGAQVLKRCEDGIDYEWSSGSPASEVNSDNFSARWTGKHEFEAGEYTFSASADDGVRVYVDGEPIIDEWREQAVTTYTATRNLTAGEHEVKVEYYEKYLGATNKIDWQKTGDGGGSEPPSEPPNTAPVIEAMSPTSTTKSKTPTIKATVRDDQTDLAKPNITLFLDGRSVSSFTYDPVTDQLSYTSGRLASGRHTVKVTAEDEQGLSETRTWSFRVLKK